MSRFRNRFREVGSVCEVLDWEVALDYRDSTIAPGFDWADVVVPNQISTVNAAVDFAGGIASGSEWNGVTVQNTISTVNVATDYP